MDKLKTLPIKLLFIILLAGITLFLLLNFSYAYTPHVSGSNINILISQNGELGFQNNGKYVILTPIAGNLNSSINSFLVYEGGGEFRFLSNETFTLKPTYTVTNFRIQGDKGNGKRAISSGASIDVESGNTVIITWVIMIEPLLPIMFILGITGILSILYGGMYGVREMKKHNYRDALIQAVIFISVGFSLFIAWLWS